MQAVWKSTDYFDQNMPEKNVLIADIGGTNARLALATETEGQFNQLRTLACADYETSYDAIKMYLWEIGIERLDGVCLAVAGAVVNQKVKLTNNHWHLEGADLRRQLGFDKVHILNDFEAIAYSLPTLVDDDLISVGASHELPRGKNSTLGVLGPGSGLGVAGLVVRHAERFPLMGEGGHIGFAPENSFQTSVLEILFRKYSRVSAERLLSGPGIQNIYLAICTLEGVESQQLTASEIASQAKSRSDDYCQKAMELFFEILGQTAGDLMLSLGAFDGVFIGGGIVQRYPDELLASKFRHGFEAKGRHSELLKPVPTWLITHKNPGLIGASYYVQSHF